MGFFNFQTVLYPVHSLFHQELFSWCLQSSTGDGYLSDNYIKEQIRELALLQPVRKLSTWLERFKKASQGSQFEIRRRHKSKVGEEGWVGATRWAFYRGGPGLLQEQK
jgi:hypothetical protein